MHDSDEGDVIDLGRNIVHRMAGQSGLELPRQVGVLRIADVAIDDVAYCRCRVDDLLVGDAGHRRTEDDPRAVAAGFGGLQSDRLQAAPDLGDVFDANPVQLHVLPVGDVGGVAGKFDRNLADDPQLLGGQRAAIDADAQHEVLVIELPRLERRGLAAVDAGSALGIQPVPAKATAEVIGIDGCESALGVDVLDACPDVERMVVLLRLLVRD